MAQKCLKQHSINHHCHTNDCRPVLVSACQFGAAADADADATAKINRASTHAQTLAHTLNSTAFTAAAADSALAKEKKEKEQKYNLL